MSLRRFQWDQDRSDFPRLICGHRYQFRRRGGTLNILRETPTPGESSVYYTVEDDGVRWQQNDFAVLNLVDYMCCCCCEVPAQLELFG